MSIIQKPAFNIVQQPLIQIIFESSDYKRVNPDGSKVQEKTVKFINAKAKWITDSKYIVGTGTLIFNNEAIPIHTMYITATAIKSIKALQRLVEITAMHNKIRVFFKYSTTEELYDGR